MRWRHTAIECAALRQCRRQAPLPQGFACVLQLVVLTTDEIAASINLSSRKFIVEEDVLHFPFSDPLLQKAVDLSAAARAYKCKVTGPENEPVEAAEVVFQSVVLLFQN